MNRARIGVVCGEEDGAPAILTEYMLAGLPVLANARLRCGLRLHPPGHRARGAGRDLRRGDPHAARPGARDGAARRGPRTLGLGEDD